MTNRKLFFLINFIFITLIIGFYFSLDRFIAMWVHSHLPNTVVYKISAMISKFASTRNVFILASVIALYACLLIMANKQDKAKPYIFVILCFFITFFAAFILKFTLARYRPELYFSDHLYGFSFFSLKHSCNSFPSGHTIACFSIGFSLFYILKQKKLCWIVFMVAIMIGLSRIILTAHYCSDVLGSIYLAFLTSAFLNSKISKTKLYLVYW